MVAGYIGFGYVLAQNRGNQVRLQRALFFLLFSSALLRMSARSIRFLEYWPPFALLFAAFTFQLVRQNGPNEQPAESSSDRDAGATAPPQNASMPRFEMAAVAVVLIAICCYNLQAARMTIREATPSYRYAAGAQWLRTHVPAGTLIYNLRFEDFPKLFFYDTAHTYVSGLDPLYLENKHPELAELSRQLYLGEQPNPAASIRSDFASADAPGVTYFFVGSIPGRPSPGWVNYIQRSGGFDLVYQDQDCMIFRIQH